MKFSMNIYAIFRKSFIQRCLFAVCKVLSLPTSLNTCIDRQNGGESIHHIGGVKRNICVFYFGGVLPQQRKMFDPSLIPTLTSRFARIWDLLIIT